MILESSPTTSHRFVILHKSRNPSSQSSMWNILNFSSTHSLLMLHQIIWFPKEQKPNQVQVKEQVKQLGYIHHSMSLIYKCYLNQKQNMMNTGKRNISKQMMQMLITLPPKIWSKPSALIVILRE
ncbi:uncharacterized protein LOC107846976 [Capsicum annuum]|uniref:uncharacterized protein LOC107846976 n=1 Tax=Capsicum annuum TaxID=4072 RepID=UPI001FB0D65D|nr:uncharacterized protein LOC107846976 [Capsicum annuum]